MNKCQLVFTCMFKDRHNFNIEKLEGVKGNEEFIYAILPYVARSFSLSIVVLPDKLSIPAALGYCYCRILDTFEDMLIDPMMRETALRLLPRIIKKLIKNQDCSADVKQIFNYEKYLVKTKKKDETYCLLVREINRINQVLCQQDHAVKDLIYRLVKKMSKGMIKNTGDYKEKKENITDKKIHKYCKSVLGYPLIFMCQLLQWSKGVQDYLHITYKKDIIDFSQFIQLANIARDVEEDLLNNIVYHNLLVPYKNKEERKNLEDPILKRHIRQARKELIIKAISSITKIDFTELVKIYLMDSYGIRLSILLFLSFSEIFYKNLSHKHYNIGSRCSHLVMIIRCIVLSVFSLTTKMGVERSISELINLRELLKYNN
jgi:phytoene/squalene synthetase